MAETFRHPEILDIVRESGKVTVDGLAAHFGVTVQTIRRDLTDLANAGRLTRVHGGAILPSGIRNIIYEERRQLNSVAKQAMAKVCARLIPNDSCIFMNIGTSTEALARELTDHENLLVVTNNMNVANILGAHKSCRIALTGGSLRPADGGLIGELAVRAVQGFKFDLAVIGCSGVDADGDLLDFDPQEVSVSQAALARSRNTVLLADHSKFVRQAPLRITSLDEIGAVVTDAPLSTTLGAQCAKWKTKVHLPKP